MKREMILFVVGLAALTAMAAGCVIEIVETDHHSGYDTYDLHSDQRSHRCSSCHPTTVRVEIGSPCWSCH